MPASRRRLADTSAAPAKPPGGGSNPRTELVSVLTASLSRIGIQHFGLVSDAEAALRSLHDITFLSEEGRVGDLPAVKAIHKRWWQQSGGSEEEALVVRRYVVEKVRAAGYPRWSLLLAECCATTPGRRTPE
eukprot:Hpha_TRINITY_DN25470_c0_g1::TRINITY_DN25470_c0_g1_i1::g.167739::m.167739